VKKKILIWCGDAPNQRALVAKIAKQFPLAGIIIEQRKASAKKNNLLELSGKILDRLRFSSIYNAWKNMQAGYNDNFPVWPATKILRTNSINNKEAEIFSKELLPDLIIVSGTSLIKEPLLSIAATIGIINLHTGLSPYIKGGPNCTNWCIANNDWHLVGNTIMWINAGIDTGNIIATEAIDIRQAPTLLAAQKMVMEHAHDLYCRSISYLLNSQPPYNSVPQSDFPKGKTFYTKMWTAERRSSLLSNWAKRGKVVINEIPKTIPLPLQIAK
jgi:methionyl-tRNA formyltransferase